MVRYREAPLLILSTRNMTKNAHANCGMWVLSALIGIALDQRLIPSLAQPISEYFPELPALNTDRRFQGITIEHLLAMTSGIDWSPMDRGIYMCRQVVRSENWVEFVLKLPLAHDPGTHFNYTDGGSHLLSAILTRASGMNALAFAQRHLFPALGIAKVKWKENQGVSLGGTGLHLRAIDMALLGYLYLKAGKIGAVQVISPAWVSESTCIHSQGHPEWFGYYGYHWWISPREHNRSTDLFFALGSHGQYIFVLPSLELVVAFRKKPGKKQDVMLPKRLLFERVIPYFQP